MDLSTPSILILGGENTNSVIWARNYCLSIAKTLHFNEIKSGINIYSASYKLGNRNSCLDRLNLFREYRETKQLLNYGNGLTMTDLTYMNQSYPLSNTFPQYIYDVLNFAFLPRLVGRNEQMLPPKKVKDNFRKMIIFTHCHGAYVLRMIEKYLLQEFNKFTYSLSDMHDIQKSILVINHAPFAPLEQCKFSALSFLSASDQQIGYYNELSYNMQNSPETFQPAFFGSKFGNAMITSRIKKDIEKEHSQVGLSGDKNANHTLTANGQILFAVERNALLEGTRAMLAGRAIPEISKLIRSQEKGLEYDFQDFKSRGQQICTDLNIKAH
ncbi:MAG: hypothetical protein IKZ34_03815 [Alphaproteobacteria bacterium]|nr:hypothetical protein [Alphaproteobacteria bacterium]